MSAAPALASAASLTTAVALGWLLAELETMATPAPPAKRARATNGADARPGAATADPLLLTPQQLAEMTVQQAQAKLALLKDDLDETGVLAGTSARLSDALNDIAKGIHRRHDVSDEVSDLTTDLLEALTIASARLGRGFGLGCRLARTCLRGPEGKRKPFAERFGRCALWIQESLADLASYLPPHAGRGVSLSLSQWQHWAINPKLSKEPVDWEHHQGRQVEDALSRQGEVWRSILTGEKLGKDMLATDDYIGAIKTLATRLVLKRPLVLVLLVLFVAALAGGIYAIIAAHATVVKVGGAVLSGLGAVGISTASLKRMSGDVAKEIEGRVWGAEIDFAIAEAITVPPGDWRVKLKKVPIPPPRGLDPGIATNAHTIHRIARAIRPKKRIAKPWPVQILRIRRHLDRECVFVPSERAAQRAGPAPSRPHVARRIRTAMDVVKESVLGTDAKQLTTGAPGRLVSLHTDNGHDLSVVWTFNHGRLLGIEVFKNNEDATNASVGLPPAHRTP